jgi:hypothetical protein
MTMPRVLTSLYYFGGFLELSIVDRRMAKARPLHQDALFAVLDQLKCASDFNAFKRSESQLQRAYITTANELTRQLKPRVEFNIAGPGCSEILPCLAKMLRPLSGAVVQGITVISRSMSSDNAGCCSNNNSRSSNSSAAVEVLMRHTQAVSCIIRCCLALLAAMNSYRYMSGESRRVTVELAVLARTSGMAFCMCAHVAHQCYSFSDMSSCCAVVFVWVLVMPSSSSSTTTKMTCHALLVHLLLSD